MLAREVAGKVEVLMVARAVEVAGVEVTVADRGRLEPV